MSLYVFRRETCVGGIANTDFNQGELPTLYKSGLNKSVFSSSTQFRL